MCRDRGRSRDSTRGQGNALKRGTGAAAESLRWSEAHQFTAVSSRPWSSTKLESAESLQCVRGAGEIPAFCAVAALDTKSTRVVMSVRSIFCARTRKSGVLISLVKRFRLFRVYRSRKYFFYTIYLL